MASANATIEQGYIISARGPAGGYWHCEEARPLQSLLRRITHLLVLGTAVVPIFITIATTQPATEIGARPEIQLPQSALAVMAAAYTIRSEPVAWDTAHEVTTAHESDPARPWLPPLVTATLAAAPAPGGAGGNFPRGYCTWYVSTRRNIPWSGNAGAWFAAAKAMGFPVGDKPRPGAIMVSRESWIGHVAVVESVDSDGFTVSEMNFRGFGIVDQRHVKLGHFPLIGFIY